MAIDPPTSIEPNPALVEQYGIVRARRIANLQRIQAEALREEQREIGEAIAEDRAKHLPSVAIPPELDADGTPKPDGTP